MLFRDLTPVFADAGAFRRVVDALPRPPTSTRGRPRSPAAAAAFDVVAGVEARGFLLAAAVALDAGAGVVPIRKAGKLPRSDRGRLRPGVRHRDAGAAHRLDPPRASGCSLVDDVLATGGTLRRRSRWSSGSAGW